MAQLGKGLKGTFRNPRKAIACDLPLLYQFIHIDVGDQRDTYFWEDKWLENRPCAPYALIYIIYPP